MPEKPIKKPAKVTPVKGVRVTKNGGLLNSGGSWVNSGRPPSELRALARVGIEAALPTIAKIAVNEGSASRDADAIAAFTALARLGVPSQVDVGENPESPILTPEERATKLRALLDPRRD